tara:strand:+ start:1358 stop:2425 length:1068 start_codon:yes stop_codon:yes gene_type:complete
MRILYVGLKYDYGNPKNGFSFEHVNFYQTLKNMKNIDELDYIATDEILKTNSKDYLNEEIIKKAKANHYDLIFFFLFKDEFYPSTLNYLKDHLSIPTVGWMADDHWRFENYSKYWASNYTYYVTTDKDSLKKYKKKNLSNILLSQWGFNHFIEFPRKVFSKNMISFVGMSYGSRAKNIKYLEKKNNLSIQCWGNGWPKGRVDNKTMLEIFQNSLINLNFTKSSNQLTIKNFLKIFIKKDNNKFKSNNLLEIFDNFKVFVQKETNQIKGRIFEVTGMGGFLMTEKCDYLENYFDIDKELIIFEDIKEAADKINFYKKNLKLIEEISLNAQNKVLNEHTYEKRLKKIFKEVLNENIS